MAEKKKTTRKKKKPASSIKKKPSKSGTKKKSGPSAAKQAIPDSFYFSRNTDIALLELVQERTSELQTEIAERKLVEAELEHMALFARLNPSPVLRFDFHGNILMANPAANEIFGREDLHRTSLQSLIPDIKDFDFISCINNDSIISRTIKIGKQFFHLVFKGISDLNIGHIYGSDITDRIKVEKEMQLMALFAELNPAPVMRFDTGGNVLMANPAANEIFRKNDMTGVPLESVIPGIEDITFSECIMGNMILSHPAQIMDRYFHFIIMGISFLKIGHIYGIDITESKRAETETLHVSHLASIGELAAGVAHEINNPINGIINYAQLLTNKCPQGSDEKDIAARIIKEGDRISVIVKNLLSFARVTKEEKSPSQVHQIFSDTFALTEAQLLKDNIILHLSVPEGLPDIVAHPQQIEQVFLNLLSNARYALNEKYPDKDKNKILEISTDMITIKNKPFLHITFHDHGTGIPYGLVDKVMNPFFSTKSTDMGTGLGLSISHGIITDHGGKIRIDSVDGEYTSIILDLPVNNKGQIS